MNNDRLDPSDQIVITEGVLEFIALVLVKLNYNVPVGTYKTIAELEDGNHLTLSVVVSGD